MDEKEVWKATSRLLLELVRTGGHHFVDTPWGSLAQDRICEEHGSIYSFKIEADEPGIKYDMLTYHRVEVTKAYVDDQGLTHLVMVHSCY